MDKQTARDILAVSNNPEFVEVLNIYLDSRIKTLFQSLITEADEVKLRQTQGRIQELQYMKQFKEIVQGAARG